MIIDQDDAPDFSETRKCAFCPLTSYTSMSSGGSSTRPKQKYNLETKPSCLRNYLLIYGRSMAGRGYAENRRMVEMAICSTQVSDYRPDEGIM